MELSSKELVEAINSLREAQEAIGQQNQVLAEREANYRSLFDYMLSGFVYCQTIVDAAGRPVDFIILEANNTFENMFGLTSDSIVAKKASEIFYFADDTPPSLVVTLGEIALSGDTKKFEQYFSPFKRWYTLSAYSPTKGYFAVVISDITEHKSALAELSYLSQHDELTV